MKKSIILLVLLCAFVNLSAQDPGTEGKKKKKIAPGVSFHGGFNLSTVTGESESYESSVLGGYLGINAHIIDINDDLSVVAGLGLSMEGSGYTSNEYIPGGEYSETENSVRLNYLRAPLTLRYGQGEGFYAQAGVQPGLLLSAKDNYDGGTANLKDDYNGFDMGMTLGAGYQFNSHFGIGVNYASGLTNINKEGSGNSMMNDKNQTFSIGLQYSL